MKFLLVFLLFFTSSVMAAEWPETPQDCLAANIYHEARGESLAGQYLVAYVTMNRVKSDRFPNTICAVVKQRKQFSWFKKGRSLFPKHADSWHSACSVATKFILKMPVSKIDMSEGALYYHAIYVKPSWRLRKTFIGRIGEHLYYR